MQYGNDYLRIIMEQKRLGLNRTMQYGNEVTKDEYEGEEFV